MNMGIPQLTFIILNAFGLGLILAKHGEEREESYNIWVSLLAFMIELALLYWGGFFS